MSIPALLFSFNGRTNRLPFWIVSICLSMLGTGFNVALGSFGMDNLEQIGAGTGILASLTFIFSVWVGLAVQVKRWHDRSKSGWWVLINLIPLVGTIWTIIECGFLRGTSGSNRFGPDPKW